MSPLPVELLLFSLLPLFPANIVIYLVTLPQLVKSCSDTVTLFSVYENTFSSFIIEITLLNAYFLTLTFIFFYILPLYMTLQ